VELASKALTEERKSYSGAFEAKVQTFTKSAELQGQKRNQTRIERRTLRMADVRKEAEENKFLKAEVHALEAEIERIRQICEAYPSRKSKTPSV
jgi:uncharacterized protein YlxW (UPF0749 family)